MIKTNNTGILTAIQEIREMGLSRALRVVYEQRLRPPVISHRNLLYQFISASLQENVAEKYIWILTSQKKTLILCHESVRWLV